MKIFIIGSGALSAAISERCASRGLQCSTLPLRSLRDALPTLSGALAECSRVIYAGYDHFSVARNVSHLHRLLKHLHTSGFAGQLVLLNTQGALGSTIGRDAIPAFDGWIPNRYTLTKRIQAAILRQSKVDCIDYYLPVVIGEGTRQEAQMRRIASTPGIELPAKGHCRHYFVDLGTLIEDLLSPETAARMNTPERIFAYSRYESIEEMSTRMSNVRPDFRDLRHANAYNLPTPALARHLALKFAKSVAALLYYTFRPGSLQRDSDASAPPLIHLDPETSRFLAVDFLPPDQIRGLKVKKL